MGRLIAVSKEKKVASSDQSKEPVVKREIYIDCTRYDQWGQRSKYENKPVLEFAGRKILDKVNPKLDALQKGDLVRVLFDLQGIPYVEKGTGRNRVMTTVRCFGIEKVELDAATKAMIAAPQATNVAQGGVVQEEAPKAAPAASETAQSGSNTSGKQEDLPF